VLAPDALARGATADAARVFTGCPVLAAGGLTPHSAVPPLRRNFWHWTMHWAWCTPGQRTCVLAVLVCELRTDRLAEQAGQARGAEAGQAAPLPSLAHDMWLLILQFVPRRCLGGRPCSP